VPLLYYWKPRIYARDRDYGLGDFHLNQNSPAMLQVGLGDSLWAFTRNARGTYVLAAELIVRAVTHNTAGYKYGKYRIWGDLRRSRYFDVELGADIEPVIRALTIRSQAQHLGQAFQGHAAVRPITPADHQALVTFSRDLPALRVKVLSREEDLEAQLARGRRVHEPAAGYATQRARDVYTTLRRSRARRYVEQLQSLYNGRCQICDYAPRALYGVDACHAHHLIWLSRGGEDTLANLCLVCPNHHAAIHRADAAFDFKDLRFLFANGRVEPIAVNSHLCV
jgi:5-methylcytosine-specific restriction enzyme A